MISEAEIDEIVAVAREAADVVAAKIADACDGARGSESSSTRSPASAGRSR